MLSNYCIFDIIDNLRIWKYNRVKLWIAFKLLYLWHYWQPNANLYKRIVCCELLSNYCIFDIIDNNHMWPIPIRTVVNCFQIIVSLTLLTTNPRYENMAITLWIAFKLLYLWHYWQQWWIMKKMFSGCELLSNYCIFDIIDNDGYYRICDDCVVNCFQIIVSLTLGVCQCNYIWRLWIAFKLLYLWHYWQRL